MILGREAVVYLLEGCRNMRQLTQIHGQMTTMALMKDTIPLSKLVDFCVDVGDLDYAQSLFLRIKIPSVFIWNSMIRGFCSSEQHDEALSFYVEMHARGYKPDNFTFPFVLRSCAATTDLLLCSYVHARVVRSGYVSDIYVSTSLIHGYGACREIQSAEKLFDETIHRNVVTWTAMIAGYANSSRTRDAVRLLKQMELAGLRANEVTMANVLAACAKTRDFELGRMALSRLHPLGPLRIKSNVVLTTAIIDMYARCGSLKTARELFDGMSVKTVASWNAMISAYNQYDRFDEVMELFGKMHHDHKITPDKVTILGLLRTCAQRGNQDLGQGIHAYIEKKGYSQDTKVQTTLSHMYAKGGDSRGALKIFHGLKRKDVVTWTGMIMGLGSHGRGHEAVNLFEAMKEEGVAPDAIAFVGILNACSHSGLLEEGRGYFESMKCYGISPSLQHYGCMIDLLSRAGKIEEAERLVESMAVRPSAAVWSALLSGCRIHDAVEVAERLWWRVEEFCPAESGVFVLLSNVYAAGGRWDGVSWVRVSMRKKGVEKTVARCSIGS